MAAIISAVRDGVSWLVPRSVRTPPFLGESARLRPCRGKRVPPAALSAPPSAKGPAFSPPPARRAVGWRHLVVCIEAL